MLIPVYPTNFAKKILFSNKLKLRVIVEGLDEFDISIQTLQLFFFCNLFFFLKIHYLTFFIDKASLIPHLKKKSTKKKQSDSRSKVCLNFSVNGTFCQFKYISNIQFLI